MQGHRGIEARGHEHRACGNRALAGKFIDEINRCTVDAAAESLIGNGGVDESIADDDGPAFQSGLHNLGDKLSAGGLVNEQLANIGDLVVRRVKHQPAQAFANGRAARFAKLNHVETLGLQLLDDETHVRGFARTVTALERDEHARSGRFRSLVFVFAFESHGLASP